MRIVAALAVSFALAACKGKRDVPPPHPGPLLPPVQLAADEVAGEFDRVLLAWHRSPTPCDAYEVEGRIGDGPFAALGYLSWWSEGAEVTISPSVPELVLLGFRLRCARLLPLGELERSEPSIEARFSRGVRAPRDARADVLYSPEEGTRIAVGWTNASTVATEMSVERAEVGAGATGEWTLVAAPTDGGFEDRDLREGSSYRYRLRAGGGGTWSWPVEIDSPEVTLLEPIDLATAIVPEGVRLTWTSRSERAARIYVSGPLATVWLSADATEYVDPTMPREPARTYRVGITRADRPLDVVRWSRKAGTPPFTLEGAAGTLAARAVSVPAGTWWARDGEGRFLSLRQDASDLSVAAPAGSGYDTCALGPIPALVPHLRLDAQGRPHVVRGEYDGASWTLVHHWRDAAAWHSDEVAAGTSDPDAFDVGPDGTLHLTYSRAGTMHHAAVRPGGTGEVALPLPQGFLGSAVRVAALPDGSARVAISGVLGVGFGVVLCDVAPAAAATCAEIGAAPAAWDAFALLARGEVTSILFVLLDAGEWRLKHLGRVGAAWGTVDDVHGRIRAISDPILASASPDGARLHVLAPSSDPGSCDLLAWNGGAWDAMPLSSRPCHELNIGHLPDGRVWVLGPPGDDGRPLWEEPPP